MISLDLFAVLFGGAVALLPVIAEEKLGVGAVGFGWLRAAGKCRQETESRSSNESGRTEQAEQSFKQT